MGAPLASLRGCSLASNNGWHFAFDPEKHAVLVQRLLISLAFGDSDGEMQEAIVELLGFKGGWRRADVAKVLGQIVGLAGPALCKLPFEIVRRTLARESDSPWRAAGPASLHSWLCKELRIDFATRSM